MACRPILPRPLIYHVCSIAQIRQYQREATKVKLGDVRLTVSASSNTFHRIGGAMPYDLIIRNGKIIDGSGIPGFHADVAVSGGRVVEIGQVTEIGRAHV